MDEESTSNSLQDWLNTAADLYGAATRPNVAAPPPAARAAQPSQPAWLVPGIIGGVLLLVGVMLVAVLGGRR